MVGVGSTIVVGINKGGTYVDPTQESPLSTCAPNFRDRRGVQDVFKNLAMQ